jgi:hypothetical protein
LLRIVDSFVHYVQSQLFGENDSKLQSHFVVLVVKANVVLLNVGVFEQTFSQTGQNSYLNTYNLTLKGKLLMFINKPL